MFVKENAPDYASVQYVDPVTGCRLRDAEALALIRVYLQAFEAEIRNRPYAEDGQ